MTYDNIKSHKNHGFTLSLEDTFFEKPQGVGGQIDLPSSRFRVNHSKAIGQNSIPTKILKLLIDNVSS